MAYSYIWESTIFASSYEVLSGYPFPKLSTSPQIFDIDSVYSNWTLDQNVLYGYPVSTNSKLAPFDLSKVFSNWTDLSGDLFGYTIPKNCSVYKSGAFAHTSQIFQIEFPVSVSKLGRYTCYDSSVLFAKLSPLCEFFDTTFPQQCTLSFYNIEINSIVYPMNPIIFYVGDNFESMLSDTSINVTISDGEDEITTYAKNFKFANVDTSDEISDAQGIVNILSYSGIVVASDTFTYSVISIPVPVPLIPAMTSTTTPSGTVISSGSYQTRYSWLAFDGVDAQTWRTNAWGDGTNALNGLPESCYVGYEFTGNVKVNSYEISFSSDQTYTGIIQTRSNNTWTTQATVSVASGGYSKVTGTFETVICDAVRFSVISGSKSYFTAATYGGTVCEFQVLGFFL